MLRPQDVVRVGVYEGAVDVVTFTVALAYNGGGNVHVEKLVSQQLSGPTHNLIGLPYILRNTVKVNPVEPIFPHNTINLTQELLVLSSGSVRSHVD